MNIILKKRKRLSLSKEPLKKRKISDDITTKGRGKIFGSIRGSKIHSELNDFIFLDKNFFIKKYNSIHPWTIRIINIIKERKWKPILTEFNIYDQHLHVATAIDMICVDSNGTIILLEFKTGYSGYFTEHDNTYMMGPLNKVMENSPLNWAKLQLIFSQIILIKNYNISNPIQSFIIRIDSEGTDIYNIPFEFIIKYSKDLFNHMNSCLLSK